MLQKIKEFSLLLLLSFLFNACVNEAERHQVDVSDVNVDISVKRLAPDIFETPRKQFQKKASQLRNEYPELMALYAGNVIGLGNIERDTTLKLLEQFVYDKYWQSVYEEVQKQYKDIEPIEKDLKQAFKHVRYYYPNDTLPSFYTMVKGIDLRYKAVTYPPHKMVIFLDMYLGKDYKYYPSQYPDYRIKEFRRKYLVPDVLETYFNKRFPKNDYTNKTFLSKIIHRGKKLYYLKAIMPKLHDSTIMRYSEEEWDWCNEYRERIWNHFIDNDLLYETNANKTEKFLEEGPYTNAGGIPPESPPRLGAFTGWMIVREYMKGNPNVKLPQLMKNKKYKQILNQSGYNP